MPRDEPIVSVNGKILDIFAHRFVVQTPIRKVLADFGKHNMEKVAIKAGDEVELMGEQKPSELKIQKMILNGKPIGLEPKQKDRGNKHAHAKHEYEAPADPELAIRTAEHENVAVIGEPHRKPKHFELLGKTADGKFVELHIELGGKLRKSKPVMPDDEKWAKELSAA